MGGRSFFFAGGGTGGHIYPAVAVAERIAGLEPEAKIHFFVSTRDIDSQILTKTRFEYTKLPAKGFSVRPDRLIDFCSGLVKSCRIAKKKITESKNAVVIGVGGFVAAPVCLAAHRLKVPVVLLNVDIVPGRASKIIGRWADEIFVQFEETSRYFAHSSAAVQVVGCPLRSGFSNPEPDKVKSELGLDGNKKVLLITGASSGSENINEAVCLLLEKLGAFAEDWQMVHLAGVSNYEEVSQMYGDAKISHKVLKYCDDMPDLLSASDLVVGRSGAVSVAEYAAAAVPSICIPYPYHKDRHQYLNAGKLVESGAAVIVDDLPSPGWLAPQRKETARRLWGELEELMRDEKKRQRMAEGCRAIAKMGADSEIAEKLLKIGF